MPERGKSRRHFKYSPLFPAIARELYRGGRTDPQVADLLGVAPQTITRWAEEIEEFGKAAREGRAAANSAGDKKSDQGKVSRRFKYSPLFLPIVRERYMHGATNVQVAALLGVAPRTVMQWASEIAEFRRAVLEGRAAAIEYRISQMPPPAPLYAKPGCLPPTPDRREPIKRVERYFVEPPIRHR